MKSKSSKSKIKEEESAAAIKILYEENNEMASEIAFFKASITELVNENENMCKILDIKQNEWVKVEGKPSLSKATTFESATIPTISTENQFATPALMKIVRACQTREQTIT